MRFFSERKAMQLSFGMMLPSVNLSASEIRHPV
jgi:hypothetical protein